MHTTTLLSDERLREIRDEVLARVGSNGGGNYNALAFTRAEELVREAIDRYKRAGRRVYPSIAEVLAVIEALGWQPPQTLRAS